MKAFFRKSIFPALIILFFINTACDPNHWNGSSITSEDIAGIWLEIEDTEQIHFTGSNHKFLLEEEGFFQLEEDFWTDALDPDDPCSLNRVDYVKGTFKLVDDRIDFEGSYSNSDYTSPTANCEGKTKYYLQASISLTDRILTLIEANGESIPLTPQENW